MMSLDRLVFDPASPADGNKVGSHLLAGDDGAAIGHVGDSLKASITNASIVVTANNLDIRDLVFATDKVDASGSEVSLSAASLAALESITVQNGAGASAVNIQDGGNSLTVDASDLDIRDLTHVSDSVKIGDGTDFLAINADGSINVAQASNSSSAYGATSVTNIATKIIATNLANRRSVIIQNLGTKDIFFGHNNLVTTVNGLKVSAGGSLEIPFGASLDLYGITAAGTADVRYNEVA